MKLQLVDEILDCYLPLLADSIASLRKGVEEGASDIVGATLHLLLGMSGEAGAQRLYEHVHAIYMPMRKHGTWPADPDWLAQLTSVALQTDRALRRYCEVARLPRQTTTDLWALQAI
ncbi:hypothetical protein [Ramlibacter sp. AN1133]|uniref:hypothetical protein n=1 Tax=Ramlibacter sp. AN1133 TaxID=3133429 RepID=UPI0030BB9BF2